MIFWNFRQYDAKAYVLSFPEEGDGRSHARRNNQLRAQPSGEMHENKMAASSISPGNVKDNCCDQAGCLGSLTGEDALAESLIIHSKRNLLHLLATLAAPNK